MKKYIIIAAASLLAFTACKKDYLETTPEDSVAPATIFETTDNAKLAINGISRLMTKQYMSSQGYNGEGTIKTHYGTWPGNNSSRPYTGFNYIHNFTAYDQQNYYVDIFAWFYYYKLISNANTILAYIDDATGTDSDRNYIKGQALVYRAYCYFMLSQIYAPRWSSSNGGSAAAIPLRLEPSTEAMDKASLAEVYTQIYKDLDDAITLFEQSDYVRPAADFYLPDVTVAHAVYARAAATREDWNTVVTHAEAARKGHPLMGNAAYHDGFSTPNDEWIWGVYDAEDQTLYYYSFFAYAGSNASSGQCRNYPTLISKVMIDQIPDDDTRKDLFLIPESTDLYNSSTGKATSAWTKTVQAKYPVGNASTFGVDKYLFNTSAIYAYMQFKMRATFAPGGGSFHLFRSAEMFYLEAEARYNLGGQENTVRSLLETAVKPYNAGYACNASGAALLAELKLYRGFDLWAEGQDWFDLKRWGDNVSRKSWAEGGSCLEALAITYGPNEKNGWCYYAPLMETDYNEFFDK